MTKCRDYESDWGWWKIKLVFLFRSLVLNVCIMQYCEFYYSFIMQPITGELANLTTCLSLSSFF